MVPKRVSINFCGGCNSQINRSEIAQKVQERLTEMGYLVFFNESNLDLIIYLSGCSSNCAQRYSTNHIPSLVVAASTLDAIAVDEDHLVDEIVIRVRNFV